MHGHDSVRPLDLGGGGGGKKGGELLYSTTTDVSILCPTVRISRTD